MKSLKEQVAELEISKPREYDPEELEPSPQIADDVSSDEENIDKASGREHYEEVGKSRLRKPVPIALGKQYGGAAVTRDALDALSDDEDPFAPAEDEGDKDPFARRDDLEDNDESASEAGDPALEGSDTEDDEEIDSDEAFGDSDEEKFKAFKFFGSKGHESRDDDSLLDDNMEDLEDGDSSLDSEDEKLLLSNDEMDTELQDADSGIEDGLEDESESDTSPAPVSKTKNQSIDREKLKALLSNDAAAVASSLATAASDDAKKGRAVRQQCQTFDRLLDSRIKLQKGLSASNGVDVSTISNEEASTAIRKAEEAALSLWSTLESLRLTMQAASATGKDVIAKKRRLSPPVSAQTAPADLWKRMQSLEKVALPHRRTILNKWSAKTRTANTAAPRSQLLSSSQQASQNQIAAVLDSYLATESAKQVAAATSSSANSTTLLPTYTDAPFYESLLRDLVASRSQSQYQQYSQSQLTVPTKLHQTQRRTQVDTKASKGRKVRYTVHEKLQNFAAAEDRSTWGEAARVEFFASLFGGAGRMALDEDSEDMEESEAEGEALRLFRS